MRTAPDARGFFVGDYEGLTSAGGRFLPVFVTANSGNLANRTDVFSTAVRATAGGEVEPARGARQRHKAARAAGEGRRRDPGSDADPADRLGRGPPPRGPQPLEHRM